MNRGLFASSPSTSRRRLTAAFRTCSKLLSRQHGFASFEQKNKKLKRLLLDPDLHPRLAQFVRPKVNFEDAKLNCRVWDLTVHSTTSPGSLPFTNRVGTLCVGVSSRN